MSNKRNQCFEYKSSNWAWGVKNIFKNSKIGVKEIYINNIPGVRIYFQIGVVDLLSSEFDKSPTSSDVFIKSLIELIYKYQMFCHMNTTG